MSSREYTGMKNDMMERWFKIDDVKKSFYYMRV